MSRATSAAAAVLRPLVRGSGAVTELSEADALLRTALPLCRRIGLVGLAGGSGTSAAAAAIASLLAARRSGAVLAVDAAGGASGLGWQLGTGSEGTGDPGAAGTAADQPARTQRRSARTAADARAGLPGSRTGAHLLDLAAGGPAVPVAAWGADVAPVSRFFDLVVTDWGVRTAADELAEVAATSHVLAFVARADRNAAETAAAALAQLATSPGSPQLVLVLTDLGRTPDRVAPGLARRLDHPVLYVGHAPALAGATPPSGRLLGASVRRDQILLAAALMAAATRPVAAAPVARRLPAARPSSPAPPVAVSA